MEHIQNQNLDLLQLSSIDLTSENYNHIELTEEEIDEALRLARRDKHCRIELEEYSRRVKADLTFRKITPSELWNWYKSQFKVDGENTDVLRALCLYFCNDKRFEDIDPSYSLQKGILLFGPVGVGKTTIMKFFMKNPKCSYSVVSCRDVEVDYSEENGGDAELSRHSQPIQIPVNSDPFGHQSIGCCFDDLGTESDGKHYGKMKNVITETLLNRYDLQLPRYFTHITTNLTANDIENRYGSRVRDRMREMFNKVSFGPSAKTRRS